MKKTCRRQSSRFRKVCQKNVAQENFSDTLDVLGNAYPTIAMWKLSEYFNINQITFHCIEKAWESVKGWHVYSVWSLISDSQSKCRIYCIIAFLSVSRDLMDRITARHQMGIICHNIKWTYRWVCRDGTPQLTIFLFFFGLMRYSGNILARTVKRYSENERRNVLSKIKALKSNFQQKRSSLTNRKVIIIDHFNARLYTIRKRV